MAIWDLYARATNQPLSKALGGTRDRIASGVSIGIQDSLDQLMARSRRSWRPATSASRSRSSRVGTSTRSNACARRSATFPLQVDANAAYSLDDAAMLARLDPFDLLLIEQPLDYDDVMDHAVLQTADHDADLPRRVDPHRPHRPRRDRGEGLPDHQHQAGTGRRPPGVDRAARSVCRHTAFPSGMAACSKAASAARTTFTWPACRISACPVTSRPANAITSPTLSSRRLILPPMARLKCPRPRDWCQYCQGPDR